MLKKCMSVLWTGISAVLNALILIALAAWIAALGGCFSDSGAGSLTDASSGTESGTTDGCPDGCDGSGGTSGASATDSASSGGSGGSGTGCPADCGTTMDTGTDTSGSETGETSGTTGESDSDSGTASGTGGTTGPDVGSETGGMPCATNNDCAGFEVCSLGLGECIDADAAIYEVTVIDIIISSPSQCYGDPDEVPCELEWYLVAKVGQNVEHQSPNLVTGDVKAAFTGYSFLADLSIAESFTVQIWDDDSGEPNMVDDMHMTRTFATPAAVLHDGWISDSWNEGQVFKEIMLQIRAE